MVGMKMKKEIKELMLEQPELFEKFMRIGKHQHGFTDIARALIPRCETLYLTAHTFQSQGMYYDHETHKSEKKCPTTSLRLFAKELDVTDKGPRSTLSGGYPHAYSALLETYVHDSPYTHLSETSRREVGFIVEDREKTRELADKHKIFREGKSLPHEEYLRRIMEHEPDKICYKAGGVLLPGIRKDCMEPEIITCGPDTPTLKMMKIPELIIYHLK